MSRPLKPRIKVCRQCQQYVLEEHDSDWKVGKIRILDGVWRKARRKGSAINDDSIFTDSHNIYIHCPGLGGTLVSVVAVVWRCALPEAERRQSCRLLSAVELADRVHWPVIGRTAAGASSTLVINGGGNQIARTVSSGTRATSQQHPPQVQSRTRANGGPAASGPRAAAYGEGGAGGGASSDYDYGYWCGGETWK